MPKPLNQQEFQALQETTKIERETLRATQRDLQAAQAELSQVSSRLEEELAKGIHADPGLVDALQSQQAAAQQSVNAQLESMMGIRDGILGLIDEIVFELDPRALVGFLDDDLPIFLMPLRVETRFMTVKHIARVGEAQMGALPRPEVVMQGGQLVRVPHVVPVGDAFYSYEHMPVIEDSHELWVRVYPDDIAIHTHEEPLTQIEVDAGQAFWTHIWYAGPDEALRIGAWRGLVSGRGPERAAWVARQTRPTNQSSQPTVTTPPEQALPLNPTFPSVALKDSAWTEMPHSRVMPDRLVVRLYDGSAYREVVGKPIPDPLPLSLDPSDPNNTIDNAGGDLKLPENLRWMQDFEAAEKIGMGIRIPLNPQERVQGFTRLIVAGVKTSADKEEAKVLLEDLIRNHHYTKTGFSIVPQGTPTNNTDDAQSGHTEDYSDDEELFSIEMGVPQFSPETSLEKRTDGQHLADMLGIDYEPLLNIRNAGIRDIKEAMCMNTALWPTTLGYYLRNLLHPVFSSSDIDGIKTHFSQYVLGRGRIPAIRVGSQPYGILATTAYSRLAYGTSQGQEGRLGRLHQRILSPMEEVWKDLTNLVAHAGGYVPPSEKNKQFLDIVGLHPASVEFYQRFASGSYFLWNLFNYSMFIRGASSANQVSYANTIQFAQAFAATGLASLHAPRVFDLTYVRDHKFLNGPVIDPLKLSEVRGIRPMGTNGENYIDWLIMSNWDEIRQEDFSNIGLDTAVPPKALLYLMLRHSCLLEYVRTSLRLLVDNSLISSHALLDHELVNYNPQTNITAEVQNLFHAKVYLQEAIVYENDLDAQVEAEFTMLANQGALNGITLAQFEAQKSDFRTDLKINTQQDFLAQVEAVYDNEVSRLEMPSTKVGLLMEGYPFAEGADTLHQYVFDKIWASPYDADVAEMQELIRAMTCLKDLPTARLERCFAEHIDLVNYRLDAWFTSLASQRLAKHRSVESNRRTGVYIGAYGWLENVRPNPDFPGIHYQEVDVKPSVITVPGFQQVDTTRINNAVNMTGESIWGTIDPRAVEQLVEPTITYQGIETLVYGREVPLPAVYEQYPFLATPDPEFTGLSYASTKSLAVENIVAEIPVDQPWPILSVQAQFESPMCVYLGTTGMGDIMLDPVKNKFIHVPRTDPANQGYIHAPSINQATAAAVLRAGYASHSANPGSPANALAVNLSSARVRRAKFYIEGMKNGQELGALLGYQLERGLHDHELTLDAYILEFRLKFPLVAGRVTTTGSISTISQAESYNVINGLKLVENNPNASANYPYGVSGLPTSGAAKSAIIAEVGKLHDALDSINDLLMAESMYQVVLGNHPRAGSALNALAGKGIPADPQVIDTPRSFHLLTHRTGVQFDLSPDGHKIWTDEGTARSLAEPGLNRWLSTVLPGKLLIKINYGYRVLDPNGVPGPLTGGTANMHLLGIEPIDLYYILSQPAEQGDAFEMVQRIAWYVQRDQLDAANIVVEIAFEDRTGFDPEDVSLNELQPLMAALRPTVGDSRELRPRDHLLASNAEAMIAANPSHGVLHTDLYARLFDTSGMSMANTDPGMDGVISALQSEITTVGTLLNTGPGAVTALSDLDALAAALKGAAAFGIPNAYPMVTSSDLDEVGAEMLAQAERTLELLEERDQAVDDAFSDYAAVTDPDLKVKALQSASKALFGRNFRVFPRYKPYNDQEVDAAFAFPDYLDFAGEDAPEEWLQGLSPVRKRIRHWHQVGLISEALTGQTGPLDLRVMQLPLLPLDGLNNPAPRWLGMKFPDDHEIPDEVLSTVFNLPSTYDPDGIQAGILVDEWTEEIPQKMAHTGIAVHYNNPDTEPAQTCLLAISPDESGYWSWDDLMETINETLDWAKKRAVEPDHLNTTLFAQVLPATFAAISGTDDSPTLDYGRNILNVPVAGILDMIKIKEFLE